MRIKKHVRGRWGKTAGVAIAFIGCWGIGGESNAQTVFDGVLSSADQAEVVAWSTLYWQRVDQGGGTPGTGFVFTNASMNSPLFNPLRGVRATLEKVGSVSSSACDELGSTAAATTAEQIALRGVFKDAMLEGKIQTDAYENPTGTFAHANLILAAPVGAGLSVYASGSTLVSLDLPLEKVDAVVYQATLAMNLSVQSQGIIAAMIASGAQWAADAGSVSEAKKHITGQASRADNFAATVQGMLDALHVGNGSTQVLSAQFGVYGALPVVAVQLGDSLILMDPMNGNLSGPFEPDSKLDATGLLSAYPDAYAPGTSVEYFSASGCPVIVAAKWRERTPGSWPWPATPLPPWPPLPGTPTVPPGGPANYTCVAIGGMCECTRLDIRPPVGGQPAYATRTVCQHIAGCGPAGGTCPTAPQPPNPATGDTPTPAACPPPTCHVEYFY